MFKPVLEVSEYFDGPRKGVALLDGKPHTFSSQFLDTNEYRGNFESVDIFELLPLGAAIGTSPLLANAQFRAASSQPAQALGQLRALEVRWQVFS